MVLGTLYPNLRYTLPSVMNGRGQRARTRSNTIPGIAIVNATATETESVNAIVIVTGPLAGTGAGSTQAFHNQQQ
jgi:hypothetical protein